MKSYFKNKGNIIPFDKVSRIDLEYEWVFVDGREVIDARFVPEINFKDFVREYQEWLDGQGEIDEWEEREKELQRRAQLLCTLKK